MRIASHANHANSDANARSSGRPLAWAAGGDRTSHISQMHRLIEVKRVRSRPAAVHHPSDWPQAVTVPAAYRLRRSETG
jgi:hypothetical protein